MKIRTDFVTNSSSSSFVIAFKGLLNIDEDTLKKYPFLVQYQVAVKEMIFGDEGSYETSEAKQVDNIADLQNYLKEEYDYSGQTFEEVCEDDDYIRNLYNKVKTYLEKGYSILFKNVGYGDSRNELFKKMACDDFIILEGE